MSAVYSPVYSSFFPKDSLPYFGTRNHDLAVAKFSMSSQTNLVGLDCIMSSKQDMKSFLIFGLQWLHKFYEYLWWTDFNSRTPCHMTKRLSSSLFHVKDNRLTILCNSCNSSVLILPGTLSCLFHENHCAKSDLKRESLQRWVFNNPRNLRVMVYTQICIFLWLLSRFRSLQPCKTISCRYVCI